MSPEDLRELGRLGHVEVRGDQLVIPEGLPCLFLVWHEGDLPKARDRAVCDSGTKEYLRNPHPSEVEEWRDRHPEQRGGRPTVVYIKEVFQGGRLRLVSDELDMESIPPAQRTYIL